MSSNETDDSIAVNQLKLTDIIDDCLEHIFSNLDYNDLFAIAHTNKQLKLGVDMAFARKFGKKRFRLHVTNDCIISITENSFNIFDLKTFFGLLRCFGHVINKLHIDGKTISSRNLNHVLCYTTKYCSESLIELSLHHIPGGVFDAVITKPFPKVETVELLRCDLGVKITNFNEWFPAMRRLKLTRNRLIDCSAIEVHFPHLEHLTIIGGGKIQTKSVLQLNSQLRSLSLDRAYSPEFFQYVNKHLPQLVCLKLRGYPMDFSAFHKKFKSVKEVKVGFIDYGGTEKMVSNIKFDPLDITPDLDLDVTYDWTGGLTNPQLCWCQFFS